MPGMEKDGERTGVRCGGVGGGIDRSMECKRWTCPSNLLTLSLRDLVGCVNLHEAKRHRLALKNKH